MAASISGLASDPVFADPNPLESALLNFAVNACDAMTNGGALTIETSVVSNVEPEPVVGKSRAWAAT